MSDGMGRELAYLSSHATNRYFIPNWGKIYCFSDIRFIFALVNKAFFVYCKVVKEKEYSSFLNR